MKKELSLGPALNELSVHLLAKRIDIALSLFFAERVLVAGGKKERDI